jgi:hypothetical protein
MDNTEIMTIEQLKEYKLLFDRKIHSGDGSRGGVVRGGRWVHFTGVAFIKLSDGDNLLNNSQEVKDWKQCDKKLCWPSRPEGWMRSDRTYCVQNMYYQLNEYMNKFIIMQKEEKIIWAFDTKFKHAGSNILLTNKCKILYIEHCTDYTIDLINYELKYHNFDIPSYAICALKMLIKNIEGKYTIYSTNERPKTNDNDFKSIYKNINEYLEQLKQEQLKEELLLKQEQLKEELLKKKTN